MKTLILLMIIIMFICLGCGLSKPTDVMLIKFDDNSLIKGQVIKTNANLR